MRTKIAVVVVVAGLAIAAGSVIAHAATQTPNSPAAAQGQDHGDQQPAYSSSVKAPPERDGASEADEAKALQALAKVTADQAKAAALAQYAGATVTSVQLENENGSVVYSVELTQSGKAYDVKVDAGNGKVLHTEAGESEGAEAPGAAEAAKTH